MAAYGRMRLLTSGGAELKRWGFSNDTGPTTRAEDITAWRGSSVRVELTFLTREDTPADMGWEIDDIALHNCFDPVPGSPSIDSARAGNNSTAVVSWRAPQWQGTGLTGFTVAVTRDGATEPSQVLEIAADRRSVRLPNLTGGTYRVAVTANSDAGTSRPSGGSLYGTKIAYSLDTTQRVLTYGAAITHYAKATSEDGHTFGDGLLFAEYRVPGTTIYHQDGYADNALGTVSITSYPRYNGYRRVTYEPWNDYTHHLSAVSDQEYLIYVRPKIPAAFDDTGNVTVSPGKIVVLRGM